MAFDVDTPLINGRRHSWASLEVTVANFPVVSGITELNYKWTMDPGIAKGAGPLPQGFTDGEWEGDGDISLQLEESYLLQKLLAEANGGDGFALVPFNILAQYDTLGFKVHTDELLGCRISDFDGSNGQGPDPLVRKYSLKILRMKFDGLSPYLERTRS